MFNSSFLQILLYVFIIHGCHCTMDYITLEMRTVPHNNVFLLHVVYSEVRSIQYLQERTLGQLELGDIR
jgi:hypothetical protein